MHWKPTHLQKAYKSYMNSMSLLISMYKKEKVGYELSVECIQKKKK